MTTRRTYHRTQPSRGHSTTLKFKTRVKRWGKRKVKTLWRTAKRRIRNSWRKQQRTRATHNRQVARNAQQFQRHHAKVHARTVHPTPTVTTERQPPLDGTTATCRHCNNEVMYNTGHGRWEHTGRGNAECFQPHRTIA